MHAYICMQGGYFALFITPTFQYARVFRAMRAEIMSRIIFSSGGVERSVPDILLARSFPRASRIVSIFLSRAFESIQCENRAYCVFHRDKMHRNACGINACETCNLLSSVCADKSNTNEFLSNFCKIKCRNIFDSLIISFRLQNSSSFPIKSSITFFFAQDSDKSDSM